MTFTTIFALHTVAIIALMSVAFVEGKIRKTARSTAR